MKGQFANGAKGLESVNHVSQRGPATYGTMASAMGWGATRAWRAEAKLRALGLISIGELRRTVLTESKKT